jgi:putative CRISPR-associated protein (TIGR02619 family)
MNSSPLTGWARGQQLPDTSKVDAWLQQQDSDLKKASAEIHTWLKLGVLDEPKRHRLRLIHTNTAAGRFCAQRLQTWAQGRGVDCGIEEIAGLRDSLGMESEAGFNLGLAELARKLAVNVANGRAGGGGVAIAATGGFKAEIATANLVGALLGVPVHYIYEDFERLVTLEPLPVSLNPAELRSGCVPALLGKFAASGKTDGDGPPLLRRAEIESMVAQDVRLDLYLETEEIDGEEHVGLNLIGEIARSLLNAPAAVWPPTSDRTPPEKNGLSGVSHHRPKDWEAIADKLARNPYVTFFRTEEGRRSARSSIDPVAGNDTEIAVLIADGTKPALVLRVSTTARTAAERDLVLRHLRQTIKL